MKRTVAFSKHATNVFFHILTACNLSCRHCYINRQQHGDHMVPLPIIESWLKAFVKRSASANLVILGGEPTLHPDLSAVVRSAKQMGYQSVTIDTNGYLFHDILSKVSPDEADWFSFSLDGPDAQINDRLRGQGCFEACVAGIRQAVERGFETSLIYTVSRSNLQELDRMPPLLKELGIRRFFIQVIGIRGKPAVHSRDQWQVSRTEWTEQIPKVAQRVAELGITVSFPKVFLNRGEPFECAGLVADNYFIFPNGRVYRCPLCEDFPLHALEFQGNRLVPTPKINEQNLFELNIPEGCVMNRLIQPENLSYCQDNTPEYQIACCMLKEEIDGIGVKC